MDPKVVTAASEAFGGDAASLTLGAPVHEGACHPVSLVRAPLALLNRHGLIAGATGTGKTRTMQLLAEQLSTAGVSVFLADVKGDVSGIAVAGDASERVQTRVKDTGYAWHPSGFPVEFLSLTGKRGAQLRATVSSFGPLLLAKVLDLNETQASVLALVFKYCDDRDLELYDFGDLRAVLRHLTGDGAADLKDYGGMSKQTVGVLLREMVELEGQGAEVFFGEPEFDLQDLIQTERDGRGLVSVLELADVQEKPALWSTFLMWMLARLYNTLPEVGDTDRPKLVFFFDEAHLLFDGASKAFLTQVEQVVRLVRSKGVGIFFVTQSPKDIPADILGQLGTRVQHALRAFTADDETALKAAARTFPKTPFYDLEETLTTLGIGEALVTTLAPSGVPTPPFATRMAPPSARMGPLSEAELTQRIGSSAQVRKYAKAVDRESAEEKLAAKASPAVDADVPRGAARGAVRVEPSTVEKVLASSVTKSVMRTVAVAVAGTLADPGRLDRAEAAASRLASVGLDVGLVHRPGLDAWARADGRVRVTPALVDALDDDQLAAVLAHEAGHLQTAHTTPMPASVAGDSHSPEAEVAADAAGCAILAAHGVPPLAMVGMLEHLAAAGFDMRVRLAAASSACRR